MPLNNKVKINDNFIPNIEENRFSLRKKDLIETDNLKDIFELINLHLYGKLKYTHTDTRARSKEIVNLLLCKLVDEKYKNENDFLDFCIKLGESPQELKERIQKFFNEEVKKRFKSLIEYNEQIAINSDLLYFIVEKLQYISLLKSSKDIFADAFEVF
ncbi:MAG: hypothetical protein ACTSVV_10930, partial [Promethearchaeota archaeon]